MLVLPVILYDIWFASFGSSESMTYIAVTGSCFTCTKRYPTDWDGSATQPTFRGVSTSSSTVVVVDKKTTNYRLCYC